MISEPLWKIKNQLCINQKQSSYKYLNTITPRHDKKITKTKETLQENRGILMAEIVRNSSE